MGAGNGVTYATQKDRNGCLANCCPGEVSVATSYLARQALPVAIKAIGKDIPHDAVLKKNSIPVEMINSSLTKHAGSSRAGSLAVRSGHSITGFTE